MLQHAHGCGFLIKKCDVKGGGGGGQKVNVIVTLRSAKVVWKCPLSSSLISYMYSDTICDQPYPYS